jgi:crotonobetainyl-CoA:carnitine CoA-transferase CaiB-like acyl-CoA transferase
MKLSRTPARTRGSAPGFGEHNDVVLRQWLGLAAEEYERYRAEGAI